MAPRIHVCLKLLDNIVFDMRIWKHIIVVCHVNLKHNKNWSMLYQSSMMYKNKKLQLFHGGYTESSLEMIQT